MRKILILFVSTVLFIGCTDSFVELNTDIKNPAEVPAGTLFANSTVSLFNFMTSTSVNVNNFRLWSQQWAQTTYPDESNYILRERNVNGNTWNTLYSTVIKDAKESKKIIEANEILTAEDKAASIAIVEVIEIFAFSVLVDIFGDIPYTQALTIEEKTPAYDDDAAIYADLATRLDAAIGNLNGETSLADSDLIYGGSTAHWKKFANSLKLRMGIRLADSNVGTAQTMVEAAVASGVFESSADDFELAYQATTPNTNPLWVSLVQSGRSDFVSANTIADYMNGLEDPRRQLYFSAPFDSVSGDIIGGTYGSSNSPTPFSKAGANQVDPTFAGTIMDYTEVCFLLADANERGFNVGGSAEEWYNLGVTSSILEWGGDQEDYDTYLAREDVAYSTAEGDWKQKIAMQKWLALYNRGFEAWSTYRLYDAPTMNVATGAGTTPPLRYTYPVSEFSLNGSSVRAAASAIGGDDLFTRVFWDTE